jgi:hypothetical protein
VQRAVRLAKAPEAGHEKAVGVVGVGEEEAAWLLLLALARERLLGEVGVAGEEVADDLAALFGCPAADGVDEAAADREVGRRGLEEAALEGGGGGEVFGRAPPADLGVPTDGAEP